MRIWQTDGARSALRLALELEGFALEAAGQAGATQAGAAGDDRQAGAVAAPQPEALLPAYLCDTLLAPFHQHGLAVRFYDVRPDLTINLEDLTRRLGPQTRVVLFIHYFGFLQPSPAPEFLRALQAQEPRLAIIEDQTHAVWTLSGAGGAAGTASVAPRAAVVPAVASPTAGQYAIASYRKFGMPFDGGYLALQDPAREARVHDVSLAPWTTPAHWLAAQAWGLDEQSSSVGQRHGRAQELWEEAEVQYDRDRLPREMSPGTHRALARLDVPALVTRRRRAYRQALAALQKCPFGRPLWPALPDGVCPLTVPVIANSAAERGPLRAWLTRHGLDSVLLWPLASSVDPAEFPGAAAAAARLVQVLLPLPKAENRAL